MSWLPRTSDRIHAARRFFPWSGVFHKDGMETGHAVFSFGIQAPFRGLEYHPIKVGLKNQQPAEIVPASAISVDIYLAAWYFIDNH